jgi:hypothetical protein
MTASADDILDLRRMVNEPTQSPYTDIILARYIGKYPTVDDYGRESGDSGWTAGYDLNAAASDIWSEKASLVQMYYDFQADGARYSQSQLYEMAMDKSRYHAARRKATSKSTFKKPDENTDNLSDDGLIYDPENAWWRL